MLQSLQKHTAPIRECFADHIRQFRVIKRYRTRILSHRISACVKILLTLSHPVKTNSIPRAAAELAKNGFTLDESTAKYKGEKMVAVYLKQEFGGFAVHLLQK